MQPEPRKSENQDITQRSLKEFNSWIVTVAHPILVRKGQLLESRLIWEMEPELQDV